MEKPRAFPGHDIELGVSPEILGRVFDRMESKPKDKRTEIIRKKPLLSAEFRLTHTAGTIGRVYPDSCSGGGGCFSWCAGKSLRIFSASGFPMLNWQPKSPRQAKVLGKERFAVVFAAVDALEAVCSIAASSGWCLNARCFFMNLL